MNLLTDTQSKEIAIGIIVMGLVWAVIFFVIHFTLKYKAKRSMSSFQKRNQETHGFKEVWRFTRNNFWFFGGLVGAVIAVTGIMMAVQG